MEVAIDDVDSNRKFVFNFNQTPKNDKTRGVIPQRNSESNSKGVHHQSGVKIFRILKNLPFDPAFKM